MATLVPPSPDVATTDFRTHTLDKEDEIQLRWYAKTGSTTGSAVVYAHGGGMLGGSVDLYDTLLSWYAAQTGVPFLSVGLRLAPEAPTSTAMAEDVFQRAYVAGQSCQRARRRPCPHRRDGRQRRRWPDCRRGHPGS